MRPLPSLFSPAALLFASLLPSGIDASAAIATETYVCGDADGNGSVTARDALQALRASVGLEHCAPCVCDADGSGTHGVSDALAVLRSALQGPVALQCPICGPAQALRLSDAPSCRGAQLFVPRSSLPADLSLLACSIEEETAKNEYDAACDTRLEIGEDGMLVDIRGGDDASFGCPLAGKDIVACHATKDALAAIVANATVRCACACNLECDPSAASVCLASDGASCSTPAKTGAARRHDSVTRSMSEQTLPVTGAVATTIVTESSTQTVASTTATSFCGTCCNMEELGEVELATAPPAVTELLLRVKGPTTPYGCLFCDREQLDALSRESWISHEDDGHATICVLDYHGIEEPGKLVHCYGYGNLEDGPAEVLRASGSDFLPIDPIPAVSFTTPK